MSIERDAKFLTCLGCPYGCFLPWSWSPLPLQHWLALFDPKFWPQLLWCLIKTCWPLLVEVWQMLSPPCDISSQNKPVLGSQFLTSVLEYNLSLLFLFLNSYCCPLFLGFNQTFKTLNREQVLLNLNPCLYLLSLGHDPLSLNQASWFLDLKIREQASWFSYLKANFFSIRFKYKYVLYNIWDIFAVNTKGRGGYLLFTWKSDSTGCPWNIWDIHCLSEIQI